MAKEGTPAGREYVEAGRARLIGVGGLAIMAAAPVTVAAAEGRGAPIDPLDAEWHALRSGLTD